MTKLVLPALVLALLLTGCGRRPRSGGGGQDTPYPYTWQEQRGGALSVSMAAQVPEGYAWRVSGVDGSVLSLEEGKNPGDVLTGLAEGRSSAVWTLCAEDLEQDRLCRVELLLDVEKTGRRAMVSVLGEDIRLFSGALRGGEEMGCPYRIWTEDDGSVSLVFTQPQDAAAPWEELIGDGRVLRSERFTPQEGGLGLLLRPGETGWSDAFVFNTERKLLLRLSLASDGAGSLAVLSHEMSALSVPEDAQEGSLEYRLLFGETVLPEGMRALSWDVRTVSGVSMGVIELEETREEARISYLYCILAEGDPGFFAAFYPQDGAAELHREEGTIWLYQNPEYSTAWWQEGERVRMLECALTDPQEMLRAVARFQAAGQGA